VHLIPVQTAWSVQSFVQIPAVQVPEHTVLSSQVKPQTSALHTPVHFARPSHLMLHGPFVQWRVHWLVSLHSIEHGGFVHLNSHVFVPEHVQRPLHSFTFGFVGVPPESGVVDVPASGVVPLDPPSVAGPPELVGVGEPLPIVQSYEQAPSATNADITRTTETRRTPSV
jgi:hypothetical protein